MLATVIIVVVFKNAMQLSNAYGFAIVTVMCTTTVFIAMQICYVKHLPLIVSILFFLVALVSSMVSKESAVIFCPC